MGRRVDAPLSLLAAAALLVGSCTCADTIDRVLPGTIPQAQASIISGDESNVGRQPDPALPGTGRGDADLIAKLERAYEAKGSDYAPRTHHLEDDGTAKFTNRLILETSPYLIQHAHNPVNWYSWGDAAFERAAREDKPVLLSVGYSTCHWCHVMERESFEDEEIARYLNEHYVAIKVDREERPDVDSIYMKAVNILAGRGGWPMTVVLTPDRQPFFGGTYFPARDGDRGARKGFLTILRELSTRYKEDPEAVVREAQRVSRRVRQASSPSRPGDVPGPEAIARAARSLATRYDPVWGGFGGAPKFPRPVTYELLLRYHRRTSDPQALRIVVNSLEKMAAGGMYDHVGGGFHRYSTDGRWLVPHFEKMLYDNAQLAVLYLEAYQVTGRDDFARVATQTLEYVDREMTDARGGFYSATDADSPVPGKGHEEEGWFFTWTPSEIETVVGAERARVVIARFSVSPRGNFEGRNIFHTPRPLADVASELGMSPDAVRTQVAAARELLYVARTKRPPPGLDDKVLTSWNGLMISAFARGALVLDRPDWAATAGRAADFILSNLRQENGRLLRTWNDGRAKHNGYLDDYAFLVQGLLDLHEATSEPQWLREALALQETLDAHYWDASGGGYFMTSDDHEELLAREKPSYDGAEPSGNSVAAMNLLRFEEITTESRWRERAERLFASFGTALGQGSTSMPKMLAALDFYLDSPREVLIVAPEGSLPPEHLLAEVRKAYLPNRVLASVTEGPQLDRTKALLPLLEGKRALHGKPTAFVCEKGVCELPTSDSATLARQLAKVKPLFPDRSPAPLVVVEPRPPPKPWEFDAGRNQHWHPGHRHWHDGRPPAGAKN